MSHAAQVLVANAGTLHVFRPAAALRKHGLLKRCVTSLYFRDAAFRWLPAAVQERALRWTANRRCADLDGMVTTLAWPELACLAAQRLGIGAVGAWLEWRNRRFCQWAARHCLDGVGLVWAFDTSSYELFVEAKRRRIRRVLDLSITHPALGQRLMREYGAKRPDLVPCLDPVMADASMDRRRGEIELADRIMVASDVARQSLLEQGVSPAKITINPYGVDTRLFSPASADAARGRPLRFLFVSWFSARKGIYDLLDAWKMSRLAESGAELVLAGGTERDLSCWSGPFPQGLTFAGRVTRADLPELYRSADVFVFPSLFEGFGFVITEAMASGLPIITTEQACDEQRVQHGRNGFRIAAGDPAALAARMRQLAAEPELRAAMRARTLQLVQQFTWSAYGERCVATCRELLERPECRVLEPSA
jgi:glycosyltransferase involved in cell wall biosynthesis